MSRAATPPRLAPATVSEYLGVRYLHLGTPWVQGAMRIAKPQTLELDYVKRMMVWLLMKPVEDWPAGHAVQLGLGAAAITRFCHGVLHMRSTAVEINQSVIDVCHAAFRLPRPLPDDGADVAERLSVLHMDAAAYAADAAHAGSVDALCVDLYDHDAASPVLDSAAFYVNCRRLLADNGVMTVNLFGRDASYERSAARIAAAFGAAHVASMQPTKEGNTIVVGLRHSTVPDRDVLDRRAVQIEALYRLPARQWVKMLRALPPSVASDLAPATTSSPTPAREDDSP